MSLVPLGPQDLQTPGPNILVGLGTGSEHLCVTKAARANHYGCSRPGGNGLSLAAGTAVRFSVAPQSQQHGWWLMASTKETATFVTGTAFFPVSSCNSFLLGTDFPPHSLP